MPDYPDTAWFDAAPDWACEALSPSFRRVDRNGTSGFHAREGVSRPRPDVAVAETDEYGLGV